MKKLTTKEFKLLWRLKNAGKLNREIGAKLGLSANAVSHIVRTSHDYMRK